MSAESYDIVFAPPARRAVTQYLPEDVAASVIAFCTGALLTDPQSYGLRLRSDLSGIWSLRRGSYRLLYRVNERTREVVVLRVDHRGDQRGESTPA